MADIKSSIEIAMERAAALGGGGRGEQEREEGRRLGKALGRRAVAGELSAPELAEKLGALDQAQRGPATAAAALQLLEAVEEGRRLGMAGLAALSAGTLAEGPVLELARVLGQEERLAGELSRQLAAELAEQLAAEGISGPAVRANPAAHPQMAQRHQQAMAELGPQRQAALEAVAKAFQAH